jgi:uncharacterized membrane protein YozB (DUF420 family)
MQLSRRTAITQPQLRVLIPALVCGAALVAWFLLTDAADYLTITQDSFTSYYWSRRYGLLFHIAGGTTALTAGLIQLWLGFTGSTRRLHRNIGRLYLFGVLVGSVGAIYMGATMPPPLGAYAFGLWGLGTAWVFTTSVAYVAIRRGDVAQHRAWMIRSYVVTFGFVTFRVINLVLERLDVGNEDSRTGAAAWLCWTIPLLVTELCLRLRESRYKLPAS